MTSQTLLIFSYICFLSAYLFCHSCIHATLSLLLCYWRPWDQHASTGMYSGRSSVIPVRLSGNTCMISTCDWQIFGLLYPKNIFWDKNIHRFLNKLLEFVFLLVSFVISLCVKEEGHSSVSTWGFNERLLDWSEKNNPSNKFNQSKYLSQYIQTTVVKPALILAP